MSRSIGCCLMVAGVGFVAGAMLASNNAEVRKWFTSTSKKLSDMYDDIMQKVNSRKTLLKQGIIEMIFFIMPPAELQKLELAKDYT